MSAQRGTSGNIHGHIEYVLQVAGSILIQEVMMPMQLPADQYVKVGSINTRFWASGDQGPPVILVHGLGGSVENWVYNIEPLAQRHRVYALDLKGFGRTDKTPLLREMEELMQFVIDFMEVQEIPRASLVGNSLGGGIVLSIAIRSPEKVDKLVLVDNAGMGRDVIIDCQGSAGRALLTCGGKSSLTRRWSRTNLSRRLLNWRCSPAPTRRC
jgi:pimeloyl-ACP methyl ester carboxylesterase